MQKPTGLVTFLFTDIEGSTKLAQHFPDELQDSLHRHHSILKNSIESNNGFIFKIIGDAFYAAFESSIDAVKAALQIQHKLSAERWNTDPVRVRIGIHSGISEWSGDSYIGYITLARSARIMSAAFGEQILISRDVFEIANQYLKSNDENLKNLSEKFLSGIIFKDLGERKLKDLIQPIQLFQVTSNGLRSEFPPLKTLDARPNNLPSQLTSFIGKKNELNSIKDLFNKSRILTITGSGGVGKTRLALQTGAEMIDEFTNGVWFIELGSLQHADDVPYRITKVLGLTEENYQNVEETLIDYIKDKELLLILDNCEHIIGGVAGLAEILLQKSAKLKLIATSREALRCSGEVTHRVMPLDYPLRGSTVTSDYASKFESVRLFTERAAAINPIFKLTEKNATAVAEICYQLDGIPLALELAAARTKILPVEKILERLTDRFSLLTGGSRNSLPRQQTLKAMIEWSYDLLPEKEKKLWHRLSVFSGGWSLEAAEIICSDEQIDEQEIMDLISELIEKSIIFFSEERSRYRMLESIRQFGFMKLTGSDEFKFFSKKHLGFYLQLTNFQENNLRGENSALWMNVLDEESPNFETAIEFAKEESPAEGLKLASGLSYYWIIKGQFSHGLKIFETLLKVQKDSKSENYFRAVIIYANFIRLKGDFARSKSVVEEAVKLCKEFGYEELLVEAIHKLAVVEFDSGNNEKAAEYYEKNLVYYRRINNKRGIAVTLNNIANVLSTKGEIDKATPMYEESLSLRRELNDDIGIAICLSNLGILAYQQGEYEKANQLFQKGLVLREQIGDKSGVALIYTNLGDSAFSQGKFSEASEFYNKSRRIHHETGDKAAFAECVYSVGRSFYEMNEIEKAQNLIQESLDVAREINLESQIAESLHLLGRIAFDEKDFKKAGTLFKESLCIGLKKKNFLDLISILVSIASLKFETHDHILSCRIAGFLQRQFIEKKKQIPSRADADNFEKKLISLAEKLQHKNMQQYLNEGKVLEVEEVIDIALT